MKILLTGATGLVGHNILEHKSCKLHTMLVPSHKELDLCDRRMVHEYLQKEQPDLVIHAAGIVGSIAANIGAPVKFLVDNMDMGRNVIYEARNVGIKKLMNLGSSCMYPRDSEKPLTEDMILKGELEPTNEGYALAKCMCTRLCEYIHREDEEFLYKTLIPCNLYGRWDKFTGENAHMVPAVIHKLYSAKVNNIDEVSIWGDGTARREFMYAGDLADCVWQAVDNFDALPDLMNVGLGYDYMVDEYYTTIAKVVGYNGKFTHDITKPAGMKRKLTDINKQLKFGWKAEHTLEQGVRETFEFYLQHVIKK